jgi:hypothetical protein
MASPNDGLVAMTPTQVIFIPLPIVVGNGWLRKMKPLTRTPKRVELWRPAYEIPSREARESLDAARRIIAERRRQQAEGDHAYGR